MAAARIVLLMVSVGLFAAAWSGDHAPSRPSTAATERLQTVTAQRVSLPRTCVPAAEELRRSDAIASDEHWITEWQIALPVGVTPGDYLLVESTGTTQRITLTAELLHTLGYDPDVHDQPLFTLNGAERTAYLVRITGPRDIASRSGHVDKF